MKPFPFSKVTILLLMALPLAGQKPRKPVIIPVPDAAWHPITKQGAQVGPADVIAVKRASSAANQAGTLRVSAVIGGERPEVLLASGANQLVFPAGLSAGSKDDYLSRASWFNAQGHPVRPVLLLESPLADATLAVAKAMLAMQRDFDFANPATLEKLGQTLDRELQLGSAHYRTVLVPPSDAWPEPTLDILQDFIVGGGRVVFLGRQPLAIQRLLLRTGVVRVSESPEDIDRGLNFASTRDFHATDPDGAAVPTIRYQHRADDRRQYFFVANLDPDNAVTIRMGLGADGVLEEWDLWTGLVTPFRTAVKEIPAGGAIAIVVVK